MNVKAAVAAPAIGKPVKAGATFIEEDCIKSHKKDDGLLNLPQNLLMMFFKKKYLNKEDKVKGALPND